MSETPPGSLGSAGMLSPIKQSEDVFSSPLDAAAINLQLFNMPTANVAKRMVIVEDTRVTSRSRQSQSCGSPASFPTSNSGTETCLEPHPLNGTLDHTMTEEEAESKKLREQGQFQRLIRHVQGTPQIIRQRDSQPLVICMVGLPARGKTYTSRRIMRYLAWLGVKCQVFNVAIYRRKNVGFPSAEFFDQKNYDSYAMLMEVFDQALADLGKWIREGKGQVAIFDGTNHSVERRKRIIDSLEGAVPKERMMFLEMCDICGGSTDHISKQAVALMPEYIGRDTTEANYDFEQRLRYYAEAYEPITEREGVPYIKCSRQSMKMHRINGYLTGKLAFLLMNLKVMHRNVFLCLTAKEAVATADRLAIDADSASSEAHETPESPPLQVSTSVALKKAESAAALKDSRRLRSCLELIPRERTTLDPSGVTFAKSLVKLLQSEVPEGEPVTVWTSNNPPGTATVKYLQDCGYPTVFWRYLGEFGFSVAQKIMGETYEDIIERLEPVIFEIERCETHLFICGHSAVVNALYGYLSERDIRRISQHSVIRIQPRAYDVDIGTFELDNGELVQKEEPVVRSGSAPS